MKYAEEDRLGERVCLKIHETKWLVDEDLGNQEIPIQSEILILWCHDIISWSSAQNSGSLTIESTVWKPICFSTGLALALLEYKALRFSGHGDLVGVYICGSTVLYKVSSNFTLTTTLLPRNFSLCLDVPCLVMEGLQFVYYVYIYTFLYKFVYMLLRVCVCVCSVSQKVLSGQTVGRMPRTELGQSRSQVVGNENKLQSSQ